MGYEMIRVSGGNHDAVRNGTGADTIRCCFVEETRRDDSSMRRDETRRDETRRDDTREGEREREREMQIY